MNNEKQYVGGAKELTGTYGAFHKISFSAQDLETLKSNLNDRGYVNLVMNQRQTPSQYGQTHSLVIDTWQPQQPQPQGQQPQQQIYAQNNPHVQQQPQQFQQPQQAFPQQNFNQSVV